MNFGFPVKIFASIYAWVKLNRISQVKECDARKDHKRYKAQLIISLLKTYNLLLIT